jgi:SagB-type dehydrogenase family enzyme
MPIIALNQSLNEPLTHCTRWLDSGWLNALQYHLQTRNIPFVDADAEDPEQSARDAYTVMLRTAISPPNFKVCPDISYCKLPEPETIPPESLGETLARRRSGGEWRGTAVRLSELSAILRQVNQDAREIRARSAETALLDPLVLRYSRFIALETYVVAANVFCLPSGFYHYNTQDQSLGLLRAGEFHEKLVKLVSGQERIKTAACTFLIAVIWERYYFRYRHSRAYRTLLTDVAELAHNYVLLSTAFRRGVFLTPALNEKKAARFLGRCNLDEALLYAIAIG